MDDYIYKTSDIITVAVIIMLVVLAIVFYKKKHKNDSVS